MLGMNESEHLAKELKNNAGGKTEDSEKGNGRPSEPLAATPEGGKGEERSRFILEAKLRVIGGLYQSYCMRKVDFSDFFE